MKNKILKDLANNFINHEFLSEKILLEPVLAKVSLVLEKFPYDYTAQNLFPVLEKRASISAIISRKDLSSLYGSFWRSDTKIAEVLKDELGIVTEEATEVVKPEPIKIDVRASIENIVGERTLNEFECAVSKNKVINPYTKRAQQNVEDVVKTFTECEAVEVITQEGNDLLCQASFITPKGHTSVFIPVKMNGDTPLFPAKFIGNNCVGSINRGELREYLSAHAGEKLVYSIDVLKKYAFAKDFSNIDLAAIKLAHKKADTTAAIHNVLGIEEKLQKLASKENNSLSKQWENPTGAASLELGQELVLASARALSHALNACGFKHATIKVASHSNKAIKYAVSIGKTAFYVPVSVENGQASNPKVIIANGGVEEFSKSGIMNIIASDQADYTASVVVSPVADFRPVDLLNTVQEAMSEGNLDKAEDALNVLAEKDQKAYINALAIYKAGLGGTVKTASQENFTKCAHITNSKYSIKPICAHLNLPIDKIWVDDKGNCRPLHAKALENTSQGTAVFTTYKAFFPGK